MSKMKYKNLVDPEIKQLAKKKPYNRAVIWFANIFLDATFNSAPVPEGIFARSITIRGHRGLEFKTDIFEPSKAEGALPCLIYIHGGAFSYKAAVCQKELACKYAAEADCRVFFPDYHLTPKYPHPAAYEDVVALYRYIQENADELGVDSEKIGLTGDSSGGYLAALICGSYERENLKRPCFQMLVYPLTDLTMQTSSMKKFSDTPVWNSKNSRRALSYYCKNLKDEEILRVSPLHSDLPQVIPDTYVETAEYDCLHDEGILYGERLREAGAKVEINDTKNTIHCYDCILTTKIAMSNIKKRIAFMRNGFSNGYSI